ncbi:MAG: S1/P1 nuclease, partial [Blastocatellia bacterium]
MKKWFSLLIVVPLIVSAPATALAWGPDGHKTVGKLASLFLEANQSTNTLNRIKQILRQNENLSGVSIWADTIKGLPTGPTVTNNDPDTQAFLRDPRNKDHRNWHFDDLPLDCDSYDACSVAPIKFNNPTDVVQMINLCVTTLRSNAANPRFSKRNALRLLVHLVGDLHQPMHVGSG